MRVVKLKDNLYRKAEEASAIQGMKVDDLISAAIDEGIHVLSERKVLNLYKNRKISLQKAAEMLAVDLWEMIDKLKNADIHIDYTKSELAEDMS